MVHIRHIMDDPAKFECLDLKKFREQDFKIQGFCSCYKNLGALVMQVVFFDQ
jgi:hypothetical protein